MYSAHVHPKSKSDWITLMAMLTFCKNGEVTNPISPFDNANA